MYSLSITSFVNLFNSSYCLQNCALYSLQFVNMGNFSKNMYYSSIFVFAVAAVVVVVHYILKNSGFVAHSGSNITISKSLFWGS